MFTDRLNDNRQWISAFATAALAAGLATMPRFHWRQENPAAVDAMALTLVAPPPEAPPPPPAPPPPEPPKPERTPPPKAAPARAPAPTPEPAPAQAPAAPQPPAPAAEPSRPAPPSPPAPAPAAPAPAPVPPSVEGPFIGQLRAMLNANKRYPTGREASLQRPSGKVVVWFVLSRDGKVQDAGIDQSSESILLDNAALATVRRTTFPGLPDQAWPGQAQHKFTATLDYLPPG